MISFLVPVQYKGRDYIYQRASELIDYFEKTAYDVELILSDSSKQKFLQSNCKKVNIIDIPFKNNLYSPAKARNYAINFCTKKYLLFLDVDLFFSETFLYSLLNEVENKLEAENANFLMLPCLYLSPLGTKKIENTANKKEMINTMRESYLLGDNEYVQRLALNTSAIILNRDYFREIGMFSEDFNGHGGEDFELLHRLAAHNPHSKKNKNYYYDAAEQFPSNYKGFRQYLSVYAFEYLFSDLLLVHRWHKRELFNFFYMNRIKNENLLLKKMQKYDSENDVWKICKPFPNYKLLLKDLLVKHDYDENQAIGFYRFKKDIKIKRSFSAKIRKLITRPKRFFIDMFLKWKNND